MHARMHVTPLPHHYILHKRGDGKKQKKAQAWPPYFLVSRNVAHVAARNKSAAVEIRTAFVIFQAQAQEMMMKGKH
jgi:hypothetical protein